MPRTSNTLTVTQTPPKIYFADDEAQTREFIYQFFDREGFDISVFEDGKSLLKAQLNDPSDLIILDIMMPGLDGMQVLSELRRHSSVPIMMLTAKDSDNDYCEGLALGADDYVTKPFKANLLVARVRALLRRAALSQEDSVPAVLCGNIQFDPANRRFFVNNQELLCTPLEHAMLSLYLKSGGQLVTRECLLRKVWGYTDPHQIDTRAVDEANRRLRNKLVSAGATWYNHTVWGRGYVFGPKDTASRGESHD